VLGEFASAGLVAKAEYPIGEASEPPRRTKIVKITFVLN
jgi:hypothetical protein